MSDEEIGKIQAKQAAVRYQRQQKEARPLGGEPPARRPGEEAGATSAACRVVGFDARIFEDAGETGLSPIPVWRCRYCEQLFVGSPAAHPAGFAHDCRMPLGVPPAPPGKAE